MGRCQIEHAEFCATVTWNELAWHLLWMPCIVLTILLLVVMPMLNKLWMANQRARVVRKAKRIVGSADSDQVVRNPIVLNTCYLVEMILSLFFAAQWILRSYTHKVTPSERVTDQILCCFFLITYFINAMRYQFTWTYALQPTALITLFTVVPTFFRPTNDAAGWFSFSYCRIANAVNAYEKLEKTGALRDVSEMKRGYAVTLLRTLVLVVILSGTVFSLEVLGDPELLVDVPVQTDMGPISFMQMVYWIFTTISTVGYGDFAPTTTLSRLFIIFAIIVGVYFFSTEVGNLVELHKLQSSGQGKWKPYKGGRHVIVIGGGVRGVSSVLRSFLDEVYRMNHAGSSLGYPNISFMASTEQPHELREAFAALPLYARERTSYFMGDPTRSADMERLRMGEASLVIIMSDLNASNIDEEDTSNILRALAVKQSYPHVNLRLMLQRPASKAKAVRAGIWPSRCFSISELKSALFALSCCIRGWSTMITHCLVSEDVDSDDDTVQPNQEEAWMVDFKQGRNFHVSGFIIGPAYVGTEFLDFTREAARQGIMPIAVQMAGCVMLNPIGHRLQVSEVVFAFLPFNVKLGSLEDNGESWQAVFLANQREAALQRAEGPIEAPSYMTHEKSGAMSKTVSRSASNASSGMMAGLPSRTFFPWMLPTAKRQPPVPAPSPSNLKPRSASLVEQEQSLANQKRADAALRKKRSSATGSMDEEALEQRAIDIAATGGHYVLVVLAGNPWQQMQALLRTLRGDHMPVHVPVVIIVNARPADEQLIEMFQSFSRVGLLRVGASPSVNDLSRAGMLQAKCIMLYAGNAAEAEATDRRMIDGAGVTMLAAIEGALCESKQSHGTNIVLELHRQESVKFMHRFPLFEEQYQTDSPDWSYNPSEGFTNHPRFASGGIFTASCLGALVARSYYTPGIVELLESLVLTDDMGSSTQNSYPWQVSLPKSLVGATYGELVEDFLNAKKGALCLGLYRRCFPGTLSSAGYVVTNPKRTTILREDDLVTVLAPSTFAHDHYNDGLLVGVVGVTQEHDASQVPKQGKATDASSKNREASPPPEDAVALQVKDDLDLAPLAPSPPFVRPEAAAAAPARDAEEINVPTEAPMPALRDLQKELIDARQRLWESQQRERALRAQLRACQLPLPTGLETTPRPAQQGTLVRPAPLSMGSGSRTCWPTYCGPADRPGRGA